MCKKNRVVVVVSLASVAARSHSCDPFSFGGQTVSLDDDDDDRDFFADDNPSLGVALSSPPPLLLLGADNGHDSGAGDAKGAESERGKFYEATFPPPAEEEGDFSASRGCLMRRP